MKKYKRITKDIEAEKIKFNESGKARLLQILNGAVPNIWTFGIITAENPMGQPLSKNENIILNKKLESDLRRGNFGFFKIIGKYGSVENPFFINNINIKTLIKWGIIYQQESFIYAIKNFSKDNAPYIVFYYYEQGHTKDYNNIKTGDGKFKKVSERYIYQSVDDADDFYSEYKGKKFIIPFFDEKATGKLIGGKISFENTDIKTPELELLAEEIIDMQKDYMRRPIKDEGFSSWGLRGHINLKIAELRKLIEGGQIKEEIKLNFKDGKAIVKKGNKIIAKVIDRKKFYKINNIKSTYSSKYPYSIEMSGGIRECETIEECIYYIEKYM
jgi:hypothetical protein